MLKSDAMDGVVRQATELGANRIVPLVSARSVPVLDGPRLERRIERWRRIATDACRQSERSWLPVIEAPVDLGKVVLPARSLAGVERSGRPLVEAVAAIANVAELGLLIGPEGGWTEDERSSLAAAGVTAVSLGRHILRAGTAAVAALAVVLARVSWSEHAD
jgi:16S rRNA (uracil1498-N3)-methyltransferase